jgi:hypothetical protein
VIRLLPVSIALAAGLSCSEAEISPPDTDDVVPAEIVGRLVINEVLTANEDGERDEDGDREDWIELYNGTDGAIDLEGWMLVDADGDPWSFPEDSPEDTVIDPGEHLLVWCDGDDGPLHASFKLASDGERVRLVDPDTTLLDDVTVPKLDEDQSYARSPDGGDEWVEGDPTFAAPNP